MGKASGTRAALEELWGTRVQNAANKYQAAKKAVIEAQELWSQLPLADGGFALRPKFRTLNR